MMQFTIDLISDLHLESWQQPLVWTGMATSPYCLVLGDVTADRELLTIFLTHLGQCYHAVFYVDGNNEHKGRMNDLTDSYKDLSNLLEKIPNVVYLQDNVVIVDGVAILGTNGWWGFDFDLSVSPEQSALWYQEKTQLDSSAAHNIRKASTADANYMIASVKKLQTYCDVKKIIMATHTVPDNRLIQHDISLDGTLRFNCMGNSFMTHALYMDTEKKIHTWCFGHYHGNVDQTREGVRYVNNCRGRSGAVYSQHVYHPRQIVVDY